MNRFSILKSSWGISIFYDIKIEKKINSNINDIKINEKVYLRIKEKLLNKDSLEYLIEGIKNSFNLIDEKKYRIVIENIFYNNCDYQPEGMYYMIEKWFYENVNLTVPDVNVFFNKEINKYIFPDLKDIALRLGDDKYKNI